MIVATSEDFTDFAYISWGKDELASETPAQKIDNGQDPEAIFDILNADVESRDHNGYDISGGSAIPESVIPNYSHSSG